jgi:hypothetical protein
MRLSEARIKAKEIYGESGYAVLRGINKRLCVIGFVDRTGSKLGVNVGLATAASFEEAFSIADPFTAVYFLKRAAALQQEFLAATAALERPYRAAGGYPAAWPGSRNCLRNPGTARLSRRSNDSTALRIRGLTKFGDQVCAAACPRKKSFQQFRSRMVPQEVRDITLLW